MITSAAMAQALPQASVAALTGVLVFAAAVWVGGLVAIFVVARVASRSAAAGGAGRVYPGLVVNLIARHHHPHRPDRPRRARHRKLPARHQDH